MTHEPDPDGASSSGDRRHFESVPAGRPLVVTADPKLRDEVLRLCAGADVSPVVAADVAMARRCWAQAPMVIVGTDLSADLAATRPSRRSRVVLLGDDPDDAGVWARAVALGAEHVHILPGDQDRLVDELASCLDQAGDDAVVVSVVGGCGGAGASSLAGTLALSASRRGIASLLVDADPLGGGIDMVLGNEAVIGLRWPDLAATQGRISGQSLRQALPQVAALSMLSWDRGDVLTIPAASMRSVLAAGQRSHGLVVVDVPRRLDRAAEEALLRTSVTLLVVPAEVRAIAAATRSLGQLQMLASDIRLVVRGPGPSGLDADVVADTLGLPLIGRVRHDRRVAEAIDEGLGPLSRKRGPLASAANAILDSLGLDPDTTTTRRISA